MIFPPNADLFDKICDAFMPLWWVMYGGDTDHVQHFCGGGRRMDVIRSLQSNIGKYNISERIF